jgi:hypothetical protein
MGKKISSEDISVVVQGAVDKKTTKLCLNNIRKILPKAEIILSTWKNQALNDLDFDILIENEDPGAVIRNDFLKIPNNLNRQLVSTQHGIKKSSRKYVLKLRSDLILHSADFLNYFNKYAKREKEYAFLKERVILCDIFTRNPNILRPHPFCPSDWVCFGLKEDLLTIWDIPLAKEPEFSRWFETHPRPIPDYYPDELCKMASEQYVWTGFIKKFINIDFEHTWDVSDNNRLLTDKIFANNSIILDLSKWQLESIKYKKIRTVDWVSFYSHNEWELLYKKYCDVKYFAIPTIATLYKRYLLKSGKVKGVDIKTLQERKQYNLLIEEIKQLRREFKNQK